MVAVANRDVTMVGVMLTDLKVWYPSLNRELHPSSGVGRAGISTPPGPRLPLRVDVLDLIIGLQNDSLEWERKSRQALGFNSAGDRNVVRSLGWTITALHEIARADYDLVEKVENEAAHYHTQIRILTGLVEKPMNLTQMVCPHCTGRLQVHLSAMTIKCVNRKCKCAVETCPCQKGRGHSWAKEEWKLLGLMISTQDDTPTDS